MLNSKRRVDFANDCSRLPGAEEAWTEMPASVVNSIENSARSASDEVLRIRGEEVHEASKTMGLPESSS